ncbi:MAG: carboxy terminal-processing peptidase [Pirellula sp.]
MHIRIPNIRKKLSRQLFLGVLCATSIATCSSLTWLSSMALADELPRVANLTEAPADTKKIVRAVRQLIERDHILHPKFNDEMSIHGFDMFLRNVDPLKSYFLAEDVAIFKQFESQLDDFFLRSSISPAYYVYKTYLERLEQVMPIVHQQIDATHDFNVDESIISDAKEIGYAKDMAELTDRWRKTIKLSFLSLRADGKKDDEIRETLHKRYRGVYNNKSKTDVDELLELYLTSLTSVLDPHTTYMAPQEQEEFNTHLKLELKGIGATLRPEDGSTIVETLVPGGAADLDGRLKIGDKIVAVGQDDNSPPVETQDMKLKDVVKMIRGEPGSRVRLHIKPKAGGDNQVYEITRAVIKLEDSAAQSQIIEQGKRDDGTPYRFGYIKLPSFYLDMEGARDRKQNFRSTTRDLTAILKKFRDSKVDAVVLDLSKNGGGSLPEAVSVTGLFIDRGTVVQVKSPGGTVEPLDDEQGGTAWDGPLIVKVSQFSASASEIFAGAIQDYRRGLIVGDPKTHGKGTVQTLVDLNRVIPPETGAKSFGALKLTIQQFYLPGGRSTQLEGVASDVIVPSLTAKLDVSESDLDYAIPMDKVTSRLNKNYKMVDNPLKIALQQSSNERIAKNAEFEKQLARIEMFVRQKEDKTISLKESEYMAYRKETNTEKIEEEQIEAKAERNAVFYSNFYNHEILNIAKDYVVAIESRSTSK